MKDFEGFEGNQQETHPSQWTTEMLFLEVKFSISQETGDKLEAATVVSEIRDWVCKERYWK